MGDGPATETVLHQGQVRREQLLDELVRTIDLYVETGILVELDKFMKPGWSYRQQGTSIVVAGPDDSKWLPGVSRLIHVLAYARGSMHRGCDDHTIELVAWRSRDGRGFRVVFERGSASATHT